MSSDNIIPHVLFFPFPGQGHINTILKVAEILCLSNFTVTFVNTEHNHHRLVSFTDIQQRCSKYPGTLHLKSVPDGLPSDHPRRGRFLYMFDSMIPAMRPALRELLLQSSPPVNCVIADGFVGFVVEVARELGIPVFCFRTASASNLWVYFNVPAVIDAGQIPVKEEEHLDHLVEKVPSMENYLRFRDLPSDCRAAKDFPVLQIFLKQIQDFQPAQALIMNTFEDFEESVISQLRSKYPKFYTIGPLHHHLKTRLNEKFHETQKTSYSLWQENGDCISWLDGQPSKSVLYVSFGSITVMTADQILEFWHGLLNSKHRFLLVIRSGLVAETEYEKIPEELVKGSVEKEYMVMTGWAPQPEVLAHKAVGGFVTHCGWNSVLEGIVEGVPMICWPCFSDQTVNSRLVGEVWKVGLDMKDVCDRKVVEKMVNELMVEKREEFMESSSRMSEMAKRSVSPGGSSYCNMDSLIEDIKLMCTKNVVTEK